MGVDADMSQPGVDGSHHSVLHISLADCIGGIQGRCRLVRKGTMVLRVLF
jgi:hypothetical protein